MDKDKLLDLLKPDRETIDATMRSELSSIDNSLLSEVIQHGIFNGGKRIRPMLTVLAARLCSPDAFSAANDSGQKVTQLFLLAIIFEYLHGASLLHDDVIDRADTRRGKPSANALWGTTPVILAGDYLHTRAMVLAGTAGNTRCLQTIGHATAAMIEAEFLQMQNADHHNLSEKDYFDVLNGKTAALIAAACKVGAIAAEGTEDQCQALESYGANLGVAFQVVDDLLDYLGDPQKTGKAVGNDFVERKMTLPLIQAISNAGDDDKRYLLDLLASPPKNRAEHIDSVRDMIEHYGGFTYARQTAEDLISAAILDLSAFEECRAKKTLEGLAKYVLVRNK